MKNRSSVLCTLFLTAAMLSGCPLSRRPTLVLPQITPSDLDTLLQRYPLAAGDNIRASLLGQTPEMSYHLVQIRNRETPHVHATHDLAVTSISGEGILHVDGREHILRPGDVAVVPRGVVHYFVNTGRHPAVAFVTFAPPYDGSDQVPR